MSQRAGFVKIFFYALSLVLPVFFGLSAAVRAEAPPEKAASVEVHLTEYKIAMPQTLPAGPTTFVVHNDGNKVHSFKIEGPDTDVIVEKPIPQGATSQLTVTLKPGEYKVYCPVGSHEAKGMKITLTVTAKPAG